MSGLEVLTTEEMARSDRLAVAAGVASLTLMENAGRAVADEARRMLAPGSRVAVLCGPGNNGGDGFVAARHLKRASYDVRLHLLGDRASLKGDAAEMARMWDGPVRIMEPDVLQSMHLVIDALFGAGLSRPLDGMAAQMVDAINASRLPVLAVDVPSGLNGTTGEAEGPVVKATRTVTFFRRKPAHLLMPGRALCGQTSVAGIGIPDAVLAQIAARTFGNGPGLWRRDLPRLAAGAHKYDRGHAVVVSGPAFRTGAARLGARGALRAGAGLVTVASPPSALPENAAQLTAIMLMPCESPDILHRILEDERKNAVLVGPGAGLGSETSAMAVAALASPAAVVLDADALTAFSAGPQGRAAARVGLGFTPRPADAPTDAAALFAAIAKNPQRPVVMTPHEGEFARLFPGMSGSKLERARAAAAQSGAIVILKGADTVIASPDGRAAINDNAPPWLATAGSGDVLAGFVTGLLAQKMPAFAAACAAVWLHGACAAAFGQGLIAEDLPDALPKVLTALGEAPQA